MESGKYIIGQTDQKDEDERLGLLAELTDEFTHEYLSEVGISSGWSCLDFGAGTGTVAAWMAEQVGPSGRVVAADLDLSRLGHLVDNGVEICEHDVLASPLEEAAFDVVHCRAMLLHVADPARALSNMLEAARPGGWLVAQDADFGHWRSATPSHPAAATFDSVFQGVWSALRDHGVMHSYLGGEMLGLFDGLDVDTAESFGRYETARGGTPAARFWQLSWASTAPLLVSAGIVDEPTANELMPLFDDPTFAFVPAVATVTRAQRRH
jgi:SAM-dependent methyltransferase